MRKEKFDTQALISYLCGILPEAETERFDELSFTSDEFAEELAAVENDLIDAYLNRELTGQTLERFEMYYLATATRREKVMFASAIRSKNEPPVGARRESAKTEGDVLGFFVTIRDYRLQLTLGF